MTITHISEREQALQRENERYKQVVRIQSAMMEAQQESIISLMDDAALKAQPVQPAPLTDEQIQALLPKVTLKGEDPKTQVWLTRKDAIAYARAIEAALKGCVT